MYKTLLLFSIFLISISGQVMSQETSFEQMELTIEKVEGKFKVIELANPKIFQGVLIIFNDKSLQKLNLESGSTIKGLFKGKIFASAGGLGSTRVAKGIYKILNTYDKKGNKSNCGSRCPKSIQLEVKIDPK